eukprot:403333258
MEFFKRQEQFKVDEELYNIVNLKLIKINNDVVQSIVKFENEGKQSVRDSQIAKYNKQLENKMYLNEDLVRMAYSVNTSPQNQEHHGKLKSQLISPSFEQTQEAKQFVKSLKIQQKERQVKLQSLNNSMLEKRKNVFEISMKQDQERQEQIKLTRDLQIELAMNKIKQRKEEREKQYNEWVKTQKQLKQSEPLFVKYQKQFEENVLLPQINEQKVLLTQIKEQMSKPINNLEFHQHELRYKERQKILQMEFQKKRQESSPQLVKSAQKHYESQNYILVKESEELQRREHDQKIQEIKKMRQKQEKYDKFVKECHPAKPSPSKQNELLYKIKQIKHPVKLRKSSFDNYLVEFAKVQINSNQTTPRKNSSIKSQRLSSISGIVKNQFQVQEKPVKIDYLRDMQNKRQAQTQANTPTNQGESQLFRNQSSLVKQLKKKDLTQEQKYEIVKIKSQALEAKAKNYESGYSHQALNVQSEVNQLYMDSIKNKLALLEEL